MTFEDALKAMKAGQKVTSPTMVNDGYWIYVVDNQFFAGNDSDVFAWLPPPAGFFADDWELVDAPVT